jgi:hypothetical protein
MSSGITTNEWNAKTLRAWQLAILRFAVTRDDADRLAVMAIANEVDRLGPARSGRGTLGFHSGVARDAVKPDAVLELNNPEARRNTVDLHRPCILIRVRKIG